MRRKGGFDAVAYKARHPDARAELREIIVKLPIKEGWHADIDLVVDALLSTTVLHRTKEEGSGKPSPFVRFLDRLLHVLEVDANSERLVRNYAKGTN
jgi:hypothetical protein